MAQQDSIEFYELIGAPLLGFVQAEHQAAQATLELVEHFGFETTEEGKKLKLTSFFTEKYGDDGNVQRVEHHIPTLSLLPIPMVQTKQAELEFGIKINDFEMTSVASDVAANTGDAGYMAARRLQMKASIGRMEQAEGKPNQGVQMDMRIKLTIQPGDFPNGITRLLQLMEESGNRRPVTVDEKNREVL